MREKALRVGTVISLSLHLCAGLVGAVIMPVLIFGYSESLFDTGIASRSGYYTQWILFLVLAVLSTVSLVALVKRKPWFAIPAWITVAFISLDIAVESVLGREEWWAVGIEIPLLALIVGYLVTPRAANRSTQESR